MVVPIAQPTTSTKVVPLSRALSKAKAKLGSSKISKLFIRDALEKGELEATAKFMLEEFAIGRVAIPAKRSRNYRKFFCPPMKDARYSLDHDFWLSSVLETRVYVDWGLSRASKERLYQNQVFHIADDVYVKAPERWVAYSVSVRTDQLERVIRQARGEICNLASLPKTRKSQLGSVDWTNINFLGSAAERGQLGLTVGAPVGSFGFQAKLERLIEEKADCSTPSARRRAKQLMARNEAGVAPASDTR